MNAGHPKDERAASRSVSLPKGGGAIKGIGETFQANLFTGTGNYTIPLALSPGRNGFGPSLSLQYSSGSGNGPFGLGWQISIPRISRKTEKGLPQYDNSDVFVMSGAEDLVPCLKKVVDPISNHDTWVQEEPIPHQFHTAYLYRPRTEGLFARIERWQHNTTGEVHWRAITSDNITSIYGGAYSSRLANPEDKSQVYEWLLQETFDAFGNHVLYEYARDNPQLYSNEEQSQGLMEIFERNRRATQLYIRRIYYGNLPNPLLDEQGQLITYADGKEVGHLCGGRRYAFEVVFDYGDWDVPTKESHPDPLTEGQQELFGPDPSVSSEHNPVPIRDDRFSTFRSRFEIRTLRRCTRVLMFHHFAELGGPTLVRSTNFDYHNDSDTSLSFLAAVTVTGYKRDETGSYKSASMPPVSFKYSEFKPHDQRYQPVIAQGKNMPPMGLNDTNLTMVDLFGDGLPDLLQSTVTGFRYWRNMGSGLLDRPRRMPQIPAPFDFTQSGVGFGDVGGDGRADLLVHSGPLSGFFETTSSGTWQTFKAFHMAPTFAPGDPNVRLVDLTGNGLSDALMTQDDCFLWFECLGEKGFAPPRRISRKHDPDQFPDVFFNDPAGRVRLADMTGDGLNDIVLVRNGRIDYWPNVGNGRFGKRITMGNAPRVDVDFDPRRFFLADLNGTGCADLVYVDFNRVHFYFNQSGNRWTDTRSITGTPNVTNVDSVQFADIFGTGTATLLWSYDSTVQPRSNFKALDFCGGAKPYVLTEMSNNMGSTTKVNYAPSTNYFLADQVSGNPWLTRLPFPVQVVDKVEVIDHISKTKLVTTYKYHHGYFDGREREFRGFGRVDQFDTETFEEFSGPGLHDSDALFDNKVAAFHVPPIETRSWFHTGIYFDEDSKAYDPLDYHDLTKRFREEFYTADEKGAVLDEHDVQAADTPHEAFRALRGALLRTEVYARDQSNKTDHPYTVIENRYRVQQLQPKESNHHAIYFSHQLESQSFNYERIPTDPRISHTLTLEVDTYGNVLKSLAIGYGRREQDAALPTDTDRAKQTRAYITYSENSYTHAIDEPPLDRDNYRTPLPSETRTYELTGFGPSIDAPRFNLEEWTANDFSRLKQAIEIAYEETPNFIDEQKRLIEHVRTYYRKNDLTDLLPLGGLESLALPGESFKLIFTPALVRHIYGERVPDSILSIDGGYVHSEDDSNWWLPSGRIFFSPQISDTSTEELSFAQRHFFLLHRARDQFGNSSWSKFDPYGLLLSETTDALNNRTKAEFDYRVLQPTQLTDANENRSEVAFDMLGFVVGTAVKGKETETLGDSLVAFETDLTRQKLQEFFANPLSHAEELLRSATTRTVYDLDRFLTSNQPVYAATIVRETHASAPLPPDGLKTQVSFSYSDGLGREIQKKIRAEPGPILEGGLPVNPRWVASGWAIFNNKGKPVKQYEPFFEKSHEFHFGKQVGVSSTVFYDALERVVATLHPNHCWEKVLFDPWRQESWDVNDTVLIDPATDSDVGGFFKRLDQEDYLPTWYTRRQGAGLGKEEEQAAAQTAAHAATPSIAYADSLGRTFLTIAHNRLEREGSMVDEKYVTRINLDIEGNQRGVIDALDRIVMRYDYDMLGTQLHQASMEAGERWILNDVTGNPIRTWDSRGHQFRIEYDLLRRPSKSFVALDIENPNKESCFQVIVYGEDAVNAAARLNLRGRPLLHCDTAGVVVNVGTNQDTGDNEAYDFKGNPLRKVQHLAREYKGGVNWNDVDWNAVAAALSSDFFTVEKILEPLKSILETVPFTSSLSYDALNRPTTATAPDNSVYRPTFNEANLLERVDVKVRGEALTTFVANINYNAKGQRELISYGNKVETSYRYDNDTFRLMQVKTTRPPNPNGIASIILEDPSIVQDLKYTYDPAGNITHITNSALKTVFNNGTVAPLCDYIYDAIYRLIEARGREHIGQTTLDLSPPPGDGREVPFLGLRAHPNDVQAMRNYTERYEYDAVGNFQLMRHAVSNGDSWRRYYEYQESSLMEMDKKSNRLTRTRLGNGFSHVEKYTYTDALGNDVNGCMTSVNDLKMIWDFKDQLVQVDLGGGGTAYYVYDPSGQRVRKVIESQNGVRVKELIYLSGYEIYREFNDIGAEVTLERETLHVIDDKQRIALVETKAIENGTAITSPLPLQRYQLVNHLGSTSLELNHSAHLISYEEYHPYGTSSFQLTESGVEVSLKRYRYTGMERDEETGFSYHGSRYYAEWLGRWASCDPIRIDGGLNLFGYVEQNPVRFLDTSGNQPTPPSGESGGVLMGVWEYGKTLVNRALLGHNIQLDHPIQIALRTIQRTADNGVRHYSRAISAKARELTVIVETGKNRFHTEVGKHQTKIRKSVLSGNLKSESSLVGATQEAYETAARKTGATVNKLARDTVLLSHQATLHTSTKKTISEMRVSRAAPTTVGDVGNAIERAFNEMVSTHGEPPSAPEPNPRLKAAGETRGSRVGRSSEVRGRASGSMVGTISSVGALVDIGSDLDHGNYSSALGKTGALAVGSKFPIVGSAFVGIGLALNSRDPQLREMSMIFGGIVESGTGSRTLGGGVASATLVAGAAAVTAWQMFVPSGLRGAVELAERQNSPGSLVPAGFATPRVFGPNLSDLVCHPGLARCR